MGQVSVWVLVLGLNQVLSLRTPSLFLYSLSTLAPCLAGDLLFMMNMELPLRNKTLNDNSYGIELIRFGGQHVMSDRLLPIPFFSSSDLSAPLE